MTTARRSVAGLAAAALATAGLSVLTVTTAPAAHADEPAGTPVSAATLTWGLSGYAQKGIFGPWTFKDLTGDVSQLTGSVSGGSQTEYAVDPVPATSMPVSSPPKTPNAVRFTGGTGTKAADGAVAVSWDGSYTVNAYPANFNAPNEIYSDPELVLDADGDGALTMNFALGAGVDMAGNPTEAQDFGRLPLLEFSDGSLTPTSLDSFRAVPDYQGVTVTVPDGSAQNTTCTTDGGATGWWGSWPQAFINAIPASVRPHFYSTGCGGMQDNKPALPVDVDLAIAPEVSVSDTTLLPSGAQEVTVTGSGFDPSLAVGTRQPISGRPAGAYVVLGKFASTWRPSQGAASSARKVVAQKWAVPAAELSQPAIANGGGFELKADGTFTTTFTVDKATIDAAVASTADPAGLVTYGIFTYPGSGAVEPSFETATPLTFAAAPGTASATVDTAPTQAADGAATLTVADAAGAPGTGSVAWEVSDAGDAVAASGTAALVDGSASITLPKDGAGDYTLTASYDGAENGNANITTASATASFSVAKLGSTGAVKVTKAPTPSATGTVRVGVVPATPGVVPTGEVQVQVKSASGAVVQTTSGPLDAAGYADLTLAKRAPGAYTVTLRFLGDAELTASTRTVGLNVAKVAAKVAGAWSPRKPTGAATGGVRITVKATAAKPTGAVTIAVKNAAGKTVKSAKLNLTSAGTATFALPRLAKGTYTLRASYAGNSQVLAGTYSLKFTTAAR